MNNNTSFLLLSQLLTKFSMDLPKAFNFLLEYENNENITVSKHVSDIAMVFLAHKTTGMKTQADQDKDT